MTIVCATHFTDSSNLAVRVAADLARKRKKPLLLINVQEGNASAPQSQRLETAAFAELAREAARLEAEGTTVGFAVLRGPLGPKVWQYCHARSASLLVVGDTNHLTSALFESSLDQFANGVDVPVLVVRDAAPILEWTRGEEPLRVLLALDRTWSSALARNWINELSHYGPIELIASHIWWPRQEALRRGLPWPEPDGDQALEKLVRHDIEATMAGLPANVHHRLHLEVGLGHFSDRLLALSVAEHVDVLVVGTHTRQGPLGRLWSVSHEVLGLAPMSVVCVPESVRPPTTHEDSQPPTWVQVPT
jgi:nucleotide-binding universal stress UspA family protein